MISSGAIMPARAPASIVMLQMDMRPSIDISSTVVPQNSITAPVPPAVPMTPIVCRITSFEVTPSARGPSIWTRMLSERVWRIVWVARTCSTSEVPIPNASAPKAPCVDVCESPHTIVAPGRVKPCSGPMTWRT